MPCAIFTRLKAIINGFMFGLCRQKQKRENNMRKFTKLLLTTVCILCLAVLSVGCLEEVDDDDSSSTATHVHVAEDDWHSDGEYHWQLCAECGEEMNKGEHVFTELTVAAQPAKTAYTVGETFDKTGMKIEGECVCGNIEITDYTVVYQTENAQAFTVSDTHVIVSYGELSVNVAITVGKILLEKPAADTTNFIYNGSEQTYAIAANDRYTVRGNKQTQAGNYTVTVALKDKTNVSWADGTTDDLTYTFVIAKAENVIDWAKDADNNYISLDIVHGNTPNPQATAISGTVTFTFANKDGTKTGSWASVYEHPTQYKCIAAVAESENYNAATLERMFTVFKADNVIEWAKDGDNNYISLDIYHGDTPNPRATATSGTVTFTFANKDGSKTGSWASVYEHPAQYKCIATVAESDDYNAATLERMFTVFKADNVIDWAKDGDGNFITLDTVYGIAPNPQVIVRGGEITYIYYKAVLSDGQFIKTDKLDAWSTTDCGAGLYCCVVTVAESDDYNPATTERFFTVNKAQNEITYKTNESGDILSLDFVFGNGPIEDTAMSKAGALTYTYTLVNKNSLGDPVEPAADAVYAPWSDANVSGIYMCKIEAGETDNYTSVTAYRWVRVHKRESDENGVKYTYYENGDKSVRVYYVTGYIGSATEVNVLEKFNDGEHGEQFVTAVKNSAFAENYSITKVVLPASVTSLDGAVFLNCGNLEYVSMIGVTDMAFLNLSGKGIYANETEIITNNNFLGCAKLKYLVVNKAFNIFRDSADAQQFVGNAKCIDLYVMGSEAESNVRVIGGNGNNGLLSGNIYYKAENAAEVKCSQWKFDENGEIVHGASAHSFVDGKCEHCGEYNTQGVVYNYDENKDCYYVGDNKMLKVSVVSILAAYNDGVHGEKAVVYVSNGAFLGNLAITKVVLPDSIKSLDGDVFNSCGNLVYVSMAGVENLEYNGSALGYGTDRGNNFINCTALRYVILNPNFKTNCQQFFLNGSEPEQAILDIYVNAASGTPDLGVGVNKNLLTGVFYYKVDNTVEVKCLKWKFDENGEIVHGASVHSFVGGKCEHCGEYNTQGVVYNYDENKDCCYVGDNKTLNVSVVSILAAYNDGVHGEKAVKYVAAEAFRGNTVIKKIILPANADSLEGNVFWGCENLEYVSMIGITNLDYVSPYGGERNNNFRECFKLKVVVVSNALSSNVGQFGCGATDTGNKKTLDFYVAGASGAPSLDYETADANNLCSGNVYYYSETESAGCWHYDENGMATLWN